MVGVDVSTEYYFSIYIIDQFCKFCYEFCYVCLRRCIEINNCNETLACFKFNGLYIKLCVEVDGPEWYVIFNKDTDPSSASSIVWNGGIFSDKRVILQVKLIRVSWFNMGLL